MIRYQITDGTAHTDEARWMAGLNPAADFVQIRENLLPARDLCRIVRRVGEFRRVLVNDRTDVAIACGAAGVHLRGNSVAPAIIRRIAPRGFVISVACHCEEDVLEAEGADMVLLAPIFQPLSKADNRAPLGLDVLARAASLTTVPVIALGGITESNASLCVAAGAAGVAGITLFRQT